MIKINEFHSKLESLMSAEELLFDATAGFGKYKRFLSHAIAHPAKANTNLLRFLIKKFTCEGDTVLDPMAGSGSTGVVAALHGRNAVQVDIEKKFVDWAEEASKKVESQETLTRKGRIKNILGDSRKLSELLKNVDVIVTSPPFASTTIKKKFKSEEELESFAKGQYVYKHGRSLEATKRFIKKSWKGYPDSPSNIGNLPHGNVDAVITSPPYSESHVGDNQRYLSGQLSEEENKQIARSLESPNKYGYSKNTHNIGNLAHGNVDAVITSPSYERQLHDSREKRAKGIWRNSEIDVQKNFPMGYSENKENIGNLKKETYLQAMLQVYSEMFKVLKPNGKAIIVIKPFIRNKKVVDLPYHTWLLLQQAGFRLTHLFKLRLKQVSFWRILYRKKYPHVPNINHEYVLVCQK